MTLISLYYIDDKGGYEVSDAISIRLPKELLDELDKLASATDRSRTFLVREAVETYVSDYSDYRVALDRLLDNCLLYTSDAADDLLCVDLGGRRIIKKKKKK